MTKTEEQDYKGQIDLLYNRLADRNNTIKLIQARMDTLEHGEDFQNYLEELDKLLNECRMDQELKDDILNMLEVEHFLEFGNGRNFDQEYNNI